MTRVNSPMSVVGSFQRSVDLTKATYHSQSNKYVGQALGTLVATLLSAYVLMALVWTVMTVLAVVPVLWRMFRRGQRTRKLRHSELLNALSGS